VSGRAEFVIAGGGTSGHVLPAISIAEALCAAGHAKQSVRFIGTRRGIEGQLVREAGFVIIRLPGRGIVRGPSLGNVRAILGLLVAAVAAVVVLARWRPQVVVSVGGFGSLAGSLAAVVLGIPVVVVNVDAVPGASNRLIGRFAKAAAVAFPETRLPRSVVTGAPVRDSVLAVDRLAEGRRRAKQLLGVPVDKKVLAVVGGSLGARRLNEVALGLAVRYATRSDLCLYQVAGERQLTTWQARAAELAVGDESLDYRIVGYEQHLPALFAACEVALCRAGASTVAELCVIGTPAILVPLPKAPSDHQGENAKRLAKAGAAIVVRDDEANPQSIGELLDGLLKDEERLDELGRRARAFGRPDAARRIAALVEEIGDRRRSHLARPGAGSMRGEDDQ
jgi:UDP-N-acetylglucosamine--N-acetylmuramyl-(pentapeptide) pyrophosphoryl-undecaprenol N-acetylglucosamine transferase